MNSLGIWSEDGNGSSGASGPSGPAGIAGASGPSGPSGPAGIAGASGPSGPSGPAGIAGASGPSGPSGTAGIPGATGPSGPSGPAGIAGASGPSGPSGPAGIAGASGPSGPSGPAGGRIANDANCVICWQCDETAPPYANSGSGGALGLSVYSDSSVMSRDGIFVNSAQLRTISTDNKGILLTTPTSIGESNSISIGLWVNLKPIQNYAVIIGKNYYLGDDATAPFFSTSIRFSDSTAIGKILVGVTVSGASRDLTIGDDTNNLDSIPLLTWTYLCITYDSVTGTLSVYRNGILIKSRTDAPGNIDWGTHGRWVCGADKAFFPRYCIGYVDDIRIENIAWTQSQVNAQFRSPRGYL
jgi:hypothetical protein